MPRQDSGVERLSPSLPRRFAVGCTLIAAMLILAADDLGIAVEPGVVVLDDHAFQIAGRADLAINAGETLADGEAVFGDVVAYWNPATSVGQVVVVNGAAAATASAAAPSDADVVASLPSADCPWIRLGRARFSRSGSSVILDRIDHGVRPLEIDPDRKAAGLASTSHETDPGDDGQLYEYAGELTFDVDAASIANGDLVTSYPLPLFLGKLGRVRAVVVQAITTVGKAAAFNLEIGTTNTTGGAIALSGAYALGAVVAGTAITGANTWRPGDLLSIEASGVTAFIEGRIRIAVELYRLRT
jgi:hypothetical protein